MVVSRDEYKNCNIILNKEYGAYWYEAENENGKFISTCGSYKEAKEEIDNYISK